MRSSLLGFADRLRTSSSKLSIPGFFRCGEGRSNVLVRGSKDLHRNIHRRVIAAIAGALLLSSTGVADDGLELVDVYGGSAFYHRLHVSPDGRSLYAASNDPGIGTLLVHFDRDAKSGALVRAGEIDASGLDHDNPGFFIVDLASSPRGDQLYVATTELLTVLGRDPNGELRLQERKTRGTSLRGHAIAVSPDGGHVYLLAGREWGWPLLVFRREGDALRYQERNERAADFDAIDVVLSDDGQQVYVLGGNHSATLRIYRRDVTTGSLTLIEDLSSYDIPSLSHAADIAISPDGGEVYVAAQTNDVVVVFRRDIETGEIHDPTVVKQPAELGTPSALLFSPTGSSLYVVAEGGLGVFARESGSSLRLSGIYSELLEESYAFRSAVSSPDARDVYVNRIGGGIAHFRSISGVPSPTPTHTSTPTATATPSPPGPTRTPTRTVTQTPTCTCRRTPLQARASVRPNPATSGQRVTLDGSRSVGVRVSDWIWTQTQPIDPQVELGTSSSPLFTFTAPHVDQPTEFAIRLEIHGFGGSPPSTSAFASVRFTILPAATPTPGGPTLTPTLTRTPTMTATATPFRSPTPTPVPRFDLCGCIAETPAQSCGELFASVTLQPLDKATFPQRKSGEFCFLGLPAGVYTLQVSPRCNGLGCRPQETTVEISDVDVFVSIASSDETPMPTHSPMATPTPSRSATPPPSPTPTATKTPQVFQQQGDCDDNGLVGVDDLVLMIALALGSGAAECTAGDTDGDGTISIPEIIQAVGAALHQGQRGDPARKFD